MKAVICGIGQRAKVYFSRYEIEKDAIVCLVDKCPNKLYLPAELDGIPFITWDDLARDGTGEKADYFVIASDFYHDEILDSLKRIFGEAVNAIDIDEYARMEGRDKTERDLNTVLEAIVQIPAECLTNAKVLTSREDALLQVPRGGVAAEIGVALGYFSRKIMDTVKPEKFYAVDLFPDNLDAIWGTEFKEKRHFGWYRDTFSRDIESGVMEIKRGVSWEMIAEFPDDYFDYVYVDAAHDYVSVQKDVEALVPKVKHGGIIQFNDYIIFDYYKKGPYGVVPVVNKLVRNTHSEVLYYCLSTNCFDDIVIRLNKKAQND